MTNTKNPELAKLVIEWKDGEFAHVFFFREKKITIGTLLDKHFIRDDRLCLIKRTEDYSDKDESKQKIKLFTNFVKNNRTLQTKEKFGKQTILVDVHWGMPAILFENNVLFLKKNTLKQ